MKNDLLPAVARARGVSEEWLELVSEGTLEDPNFVRAIREAAKRQMWDLVAPKVREALFVPELQIRALGGSLDDLLADLEFYRLEHVMNSLEWHLEERARADADRGRQAAPALDALEQVNRGRIAAANERALRWHHEIERRPAGVRKVGAMGKIAEREGLTIEAIKQALKAYRKRNSRK